MKTEAVSRLSTLATSIGTLARNEAGALPQVTFSKENVVRRGTSVTVTPLAIAGIGSGSAISAATALEEVIAGNAVYGPT